jgi:hypothetical protein
MFSSFPLASPKCPRIHTLSGIVLDGVPDLLFEQGDPHLEKWRTLGKKDFARKTPVVRGKKTKKDNVICADSVRLE